MPSITVTNLDNLPQGVGYDGNASRTGNAITWNNQRGGFTLWYSSNDPNITFEVGDKVQLALTVDSWTRGYLRCYCRGQLNPSSTGAGDTNNLWNWLVIQGMTPDNVGQSANASVRTNATGTIILELTCITQCYGFTFYFGAVGNDWGSNYGTGTVTFNYLTTQFEPVDPYSWVDPTGPSEPIDTHPLPHDNVGFPDMPTATLADAGFVSLWTPTKEQLQTLARYMWNIDITSIDFWKKLVASPLELIFGLSIIPYDVHDDDSPYHVYQDVLTMGYVNTHIDMDYIEEQFIEIDFGSVDLTEYIGAYLDYDPYTKFSIYLPYIGVKDLSADDIMNRTISLKYRIDLASGACVAMIKCTGTDATVGSVDSVFYSFSGSCSTQVPISASQQQELVRSIVSIGVGVAATAATIFTGGLTAVGAATAVGATANGALGLKSHYAHSGNMGSTAGFMGVQNPYLIVSRPRLAIPGDQNVYMGYPSFITMTLGDLSGYTEVEVTHLDRLDCTEEEMSEIAELLRKGVYF